MLYHFYFCTVVLLVVIIVIVIPVDDIVSLAIHSSQIPTGINIYKFSIKMNLFFL